MDRADHTFQVPNRSWLGSELIDTLTEAEVRFECHEDLHNGDVVFVFPNAEEQREAARIRDLNESGDWVYHARDQDPRFSRRRLG